MADRQAVHIFAGINLPYSLHLRYGGNVLIAEAQSGEQPEVHGILLSKIGVSGVAHIAAGSAHACKEAHADGDDEQNGAEAVQRFAHGAEGILPESLGHALPPFFWDSMQVTTRWWRYRRGGDYRYCWRPCCCGW